MVSFLSTVEVKNCCLIFSRHAVFMRSLPIRSSRAWTRLKEIQLLDGEATQSFIHSSHSD